MDKNVKYIDKEVVGMTEIYEAIKSVLDEYIPEIKLEYISSAMGRFLTINYMDMQVLFLDVNIDISIYREDKNLFIGGINFDHALINAALEKYIKSGVLSNEIRQYLYKIVINNRQITVNTLKYFSSHNNNLLDGYDLYRSFGKNLIDKTLSIIQLNSLTDK